MTIELTVLRDEHDTAAPGDEAFRAWVNRATEGQGGSLAIRLVGKPESQALNARYRDRDKPTNVLSFPADLPPEIMQALDPVPLGDLVICAPLVVEEAAAQGKAVEAHWAHLVMHGVLHLRGYDHETEAEAERMESLERTLLAELGIADPYATR